MNAYRTIEVRGTLPATPGYPDVVQAYMAEMVRHITQHQIEMVNAALLATSIDRWHLFRWSSPEISTGIDASVGLGTDDLKLWAEQDPPTVWCEYPLEPKEPAMPQPNTAGIDDLDNDWPAPDMRYGFPHNVLGHPLLVLCPKLGEWIHRHTRPEVPRWFR